MRWWHKTLLVLLLLLLLLTAGGYWALRQAISAAPVQDLSFSLSSVSWHQLQLGHLSFKEPQSEAEVELHDIRISWQQMGLLLQGKLQRVGISSGTIKLHTWPKSEQLSASSDTAISTGPKQTGWQPELAEHWRLPANLPAKVTLNNISLHLPCSETLCQYRLNASFNIAPEQAEIQLSLTDALSESEQGLFISGQYLVNEALPQLAINVRLDDSLTLQLNQQLSQLSPLSGNGELKLDISPPTEWLIQQFQHWQLPLEPEDIARFNAPVSLHSQWQLELPQLGNLQQVLDKANVQWLLNANLPDALSIPGVGLLQGKFDAELGLNAGEISRYQLNSQLNLLKPQLPQQLADLGSQIDTIRLDVSSKASGAPQLTSLPLQLSLHTNGKTQLDLSTAVTLNLTPPLTAQFKQTELTLRQNKLALPSDISATKLALQSGFNAYRLADNWLLELNKLSIDAATLKAADVQATSLKAELNKARITGDASTLLSQFSGSLKLSVANIIQSELKAQSWQWQGDVKGSSKDNNSVLAVSGKLSNGAGLNLSHQLQYDGNTELNWQLQEIFLLAGNPLQATFSQWPALLELNRGKLQAEGNLQLQNDQITTQARLALSGVNGLYDTTLFKQLSTEIFATVQQDKLTLTTTASRVGEINRGLIGGPVDVSAQYLADIHSPLAGMLTLQQAQMQLMGGNISVQPATLDLSASTQQLTLDIKQLDISQLLAQHPTTDLAGNGRISGKVPLIISKAGATVTAGTLSAETPGGVLQYRPAGAAGMAASNPGMKVMLQALDDFHYSVLASEVSYDTSGKLLLALTLKGSNPALEKGRPINLTINLEEDLPALITSLQLSSQISDKIKQRVQQHIQQQRAKSANGAKP